MATTLRTVLATLAMFALAAPAPVLAQASPEMDALAAACNANPAFFDFKVQGLATDPERLGALCGCLVTAFGDYPAADLVMLTKDLDDTATNESRIAYGDYTALQTRALAALDGCLTETAGAGADMANFDAACTGGPVMLEVVEGNEANRATVCGCLSTTLATRISTADADVLATDLNGTASEESHAQHENYDAVAELAGGVLNECFAALPAPASP